LTINLDDLRFLAWLLAFFAFGYLLARSSRPRV